MDRRTLHLLAACALTLIVSGTSWAQCSSGCGCASCNRGGVSTGLYHQPSAPHHDRVYQAGYTHWTPYRGQHTHGHFVNVPHFAPAQAAPQYRNNTYYPQVWGYR